ncbi:uncharacterized protein LOC114523489 isoform X2 [Dendronephthya gigantea]|uniref:uncharacterized protein LOC114523489 isoform X2 n=1 Tax=Dendronephthya gigantea TaxID=151771 RepID=UPI001069CE2F|nr:uncharacterized protein LOC114523489 isoform X2 [Dendronephthya gigantea]
MSSIKQIIFILFITTAADGFFINLWNKIVHNPEPGKRWTDLKVTFRKFSSLPETMRDAEKGGWKKTASCNDVSSYFRGNRYVLGSDTSTMVLYDSKGDFAGIQFGIAKSLATHKSFKKSHWNEEGDSFVITAYFTHPSRICQGERTKDNLFIQTGPTPNDLMSIPYEESNLGPTPWVKGKCFLLMGQHYWFNVSKDMSCDDTFPVFLLYNKQKLIGFGWAMIADLQKTKRVEHPSQSQVKYFFDEKTQPKCLAEQGIKLTTQHVYLKKYPWFIICPLFG